MLDNLKNEIIQVLKNEISTLKDTVQNLSSRVQDVESQNKFLKEELAHKKNNGIQSVIKELELRKRRESNIMIFGLVEKVIGTAEERMGHDDACVKSIVNALDISDIDVIASRRIGGSGLSHKDRS